MLDNFAQMLDRIDGYSADNGGLLAVGLGDVDLFFTEVPCGDYHG